MKTVLFSLALVLFSAVSASAFKTVVIDAGHGGRDVGGAYGKVYEKWLALDTAMRVEKKLKRKGFRTVMTRQSDNFISLPARARMGNRYGNSIFVSVHYNFTWKKAVSGLETFYYQSKAKPLAQFVQNGMIREVKAKSRGVKYGRFYVLRHSKSPAILVEAGFVSNARERGRTKEGWYREGIADGIVDGIVKYQKLSSRW